MQLNHPGEVEHYAFFSAHLGSRFQSAGLRVQFHHNQEPGIHFTIQPPGEYADAIMKGVSDGLTRYFPSFPDSGSVWIKEVTAHDVDPSPAAFYRAGLLVMSQACALAEIVESGERMTDSV